MQSLTDHFSEEIKKNINKNELLKIIEREFKNKKDIIQEISEYKLAFYEQYGNTMIIECPYCKKKHHHSIGFDGYQSRTAECYGSKYILCEKN